MPFTAITSISARTHFEGVIRDSSASVVCGIGFADLSGFTALTQLLTPAELSTCSTSSAPPSPTSCTPTAVGW